MAVCILCIAAAVGLLSGCAQQAVVAPDPSIFLTTIVKQDQKEKIQDILESVAERNRTIERNPTWISRAYRQYLITELADVPEDEYASYSKYLDDGDLYIVVHPAYYPFFDSNSSSLFEPLGSDSRPNVVDQFLVERTFSDKTRLIQAQERMLRDFLEYASTAKKLVLLILPGDYTESSTCRCSGGHDEYMRYINEVTNESESVLYLYSKKTSSGSLGAEAKKRLRKFLAAVAPKEVLVGGGYLGRCVEEASRDIHDVYRHRLFLIPEITSWSPSDVSSSEASALIQSDGSINIRQMTAAAGRKQHNAKKSNLQVRDTEEHPE